MLISAEGGVLSRSTANPSLANGHLAIWLTCSAFLLGSITVGSGQPWLLPFFVALAYTAILITAISSVRTLRDSLNPLCLICAIAFVRHLLPGLFLLNGAEPPDEVRRFFDAMKLSEGDWRWGHALALWGLLAALVGWFLVQQSRVRNGPRKIDFHLVPGVKPAACVGMLLGFAALSVFLVSNASLDVITSGAFRGTTIQQGTGKYFFLAYLLISGSVLLSCYYLAGGQKAVALVPVASATLFYWILGGRNRAIVSLAAGLLLLWYHHRQRDGWPKVTMNYRYIFMAPAVMFSVLWVSYMGALYRGELGARAFSDGMSLQGITEYLQASIYTDLGQLHSLAGAIAIGPGILGGQTFFGALSWPLNAFIFIPGRSAGVFIVETLVGFAGEGDKWAVNASLIGDAYLNFGLWGVPAVMMLYGAILKTLYVKFRQGRLHAAIYVLVFICSLQMSWGSIEVWPQTLTILAFAWGIHFVGRNVLQIDHSGAIPPAGYKHGQVR